MRIPRGDFITVRRSRLVVLGGLTAMLAFLGSPYLPFPLLAGLLCVAGVLASYHFGGDD